MNLKNFKILLINLLMLFSYFSCSSESMKMLSEFKKQNFIVLSVPVKLENLNPTSSLNAHSKLSLTLVFEPLVSISSKQDLFPVLAKSWSVSDGGKSILIEIKNKHYFSDGTEVTAHDVINSINRVCSKNSEVYEELKGLVGCTDHAKGLPKKPAVELVDRYNILFHINSSPTIFLYQLSSPSIVITKKVGSQLIGSGPYIINTFNESYVLLKKNTYSSTDNSTSTNGVALTYVNPKYLRNLLNKNLIDGAIMYRMQDIWHINTKDYKLIKMNPNITEMLVLNNQRYPFNHSIVRKAILSNLYNNFNSECFSGSTRAYGIIPSGIGGSISNSSPKYMKTILPDQVFKVVPELKTSDMNIVIHQLSELKNKCEAKLIVNAAKPYHINISYRYHNDYLSLQPLINNHRLDGFIDLYVFRSRDAYSILQFFSGGGANDANIKTNKIDSMLNDALSTTSSHNRFMIYRNIGNYMQKQGIVLPLYYMDHGNLINDCITSIFDDFLFNPFLYIPKLQFSKKCKLIKGVGYE